MRSCPALALAVAYSALLRACLSSRPPAGGVVLEIGPSGSPVLAWTGESQASSLAAVGRRSAAGSSSSIGEEEGPTIEEGGSSYHEFIAGGSFAVLLVVAAATYCSGICVRLRRAARTWYVAAAPPGSVHILHQGDEASLRTAASVAATLRGLGCTVTGACDSQGDELARVAALPADTDLVLCVLTPTIFAVDAARAELLRAKGLGIPVIPVHAGDQFPRDALTPMISCSPSELVARDFPAGGEDAEFLHQVRKYVFRENIRDVDNMYHAKACVATVRLLAQRAAEYKAQRVQEVPGDHYEHDVFISYSSRDGWEVFESVAAIFEGLGLQVFNPSKDLQRTEVSMAEMVRHVQGSRFLIQVNTPHYVSSKWCRAELLAAEEAGIPIHSVFAGKKTTGRQMLDFLNTPAESGSRDQDGVDKAKACILGAIERRGMVDAYNPDFAEEAVDDLGAIAYQHIAWLRWTRRLKLVGIGVTICLLLGIILLTAIMVRMAEMEKDCAAKNLDHLEETAWLFDNSAMRRLDPGSFKAAHDCVYRLKVSRDFRKAAKEGDHDQVMNIYKTVKANIDDGEIVHEGLRTITMLAYANRGTLEHFAPALIREAMQAHWRQTWLLLDAARLLTHFARASLLPDVCAFVDSLIRMLEQHRDDVRLQQQAVWVLRAVVSGKLMQGNNAVQTCADRAFSACANAMEDNRRVEGVQEHAIVCLRRLARWPISPSSLLRGAALSVEAMQAHAGRPVLIASAARALLEMGNHSREVRGWLANNGTLVGLLLEATNSTGVGEDVFSKHTSSLLHMLKSWSANVSLPGMDEGGVQIVVQAALRETDPEVVHQLVALLRQLATQPQYMPVLFQRDAMRAAATAISGRAEELTVCDALDLVHELADRGVNKEKGPELLREAVTNVSRRVDENWNNLGEAAREKTVALFAFAARWPDLRRKWMNISMAKKTIDCLGSPWDGEKLQASVMKLWILLAQDLGNVQDLRDMSAGTKLLGVLASDTSEASAALALDLIARIGSSDDMIHFGLIPIVVAEMGRRRSSVDIQCKGMDVLRLAYNGWWWCENISSALPNLTQLDPGDLRRLKSEVGLLSTMAGTQPKCVGMKVQGSLGTIIAVMRGLPADLPLQMDAVTLVTQMVALDDARAESTPVEDWAVVLLAACQAHIGSEDLQVRVAANLRAFARHRGETNMFQHVLAQLLDIMRNHRDSEALQVLAVRLLEMTAADGDPWPDNRWLAQPRRCDSKTAVPKWLREVREHIGSEAVPVILHALDTFPFNTTIQTRASSLFQFLAATSIPTLPQKLIEAGVVGYLLPNHYKVHPNATIDVAQKVRLMLSLCALQNLSARMVSEKMNGQLVQRLQTAGTEEAMTMQGRSELVKGAFKGMLEDNCESYFVMLRHLNSFNTTRVFMVKNGLLKCAADFSTLCTGAAGGRYSSDVLMMLLPLTEDDSIKPVLIRYGIVNFLQRLLPEYHPTTSPGQPCIGRGKSAASDKITMHILARLAQVPQYRKVIVVQGAAAIAYAITVVLNQTDTTTLGFAVWLLEPLAGVLVGHPDGQLAGVVLHTAIANPHLLPDIRQQAKAALQLVGEPTEQGVAAALKRSTLLERLEAIPESRC